MNTAATLTHALPRHTRQTIAQKRVVRRRRSLASIVETALDPRYPQRHGLRPWPRIPAHNRMVVLEPLTSVAGLLRDPKVTIPERTLRRIMAFVTDPASPAYGRYPNQAGFAAYALADDVGTLAR